MTEILKSPVFWIIAAVISLLIMLFFIWCGYAFLDKPFIFDRSGRLENDVRKLVSDRKKWVLHPQNPF